MLPTMYILTKTACIKTRYLHHKFGNGSREPITFLFQSASIPCCKNWNAVFTFILSDFRLADERETKERSTTVFVDETTFCDYLVVGLSTANFTGLVLSFVIYCKLCGTTV